MEDLKEDKVKKLNDLLQFLCNMNKIRIRDYYEDAFIVRYTIYNLNSNIKAEIRIENNFIKSIKYYTNEDDTEIKMDELEEMKKLIECIINFGTINSNED